MNKTLVLATLTAVIIGAGCSKKEPPTTANAEADPAAPAPAAATNWAPEEATAPAAHDPNDGKDHSGHNH